MVENNSCELDTIKPKLDTITFGKNGAIEIRYSGNIIIDTKENQAKLYNGLKKLQEQVDWQKEKIESLKKELSQVKTELVKERENVASEKRKYEKLKEYWKAFKERQGKGRPVVLTKEIQQEIANLWTQEKIRNIAEIHRRLQESGFKGEYETVRKYIQERKRRHIEAAKMAKEANQE